MPQELFANTTFKLFLEEIAALGFSISLSPQSGAIPYGIIGGRSNARWWLIPLNNRLVATSGLALFQPILPSARIMKNMASLLSSIGLSSLWARNKVYISHPPVFFDLFDDRNLSYAFFTGTDSPHRKTTLQIMDNKGEIRGFSKISKKKGVKKLIRHETDSLEYAQSLHLKKGYIPQPLLSYDINGASVLVTDTLKTRYSTSPVVFTRYHEAFLSELASKSNSGELLCNSSFLKFITCRNRKLYAYLSDDWRKRLSRAIEEINHAAKKIKTRMVTCHGDFTPWNTFIVKNKLYVFDWEYAKRGYPPGYDLIHFHLSMPITKRQSTYETIKQIRVLMQEKQIAENNTEADILFLCYLCGHTLQYIAREVDQNNTIKHWDGKKEATILIDTIING